MPALMEKTGYRRLKPVRNEQAIIERPILMKGEMVRATLADIKTQTRRAMNPQPTGEPMPLIEWSRGLATACHDHSPDPEKLTAHAEKLRGHVFPFTTPNGSLMSPACPYGKPGDRLWVRETFNTSENVRPRISEPYIYRADDRWSATWKPSIFMPRGASRINLEIVDIRVERVQDISEADAIAEGCKAQLPNTKYFHRSARGAYKLLWDSINAKRGYGWDVNPWVWVIVFKRVK